MEPLMTAKYDKSNKKSEHNTHNNKKYERDNVPKLFQSRLRIK